jgi:hypothetical protein
MMARNKGEVIGARHIAIATDCGELALYELEDNGYITFDEDGICRIIHWYENNGLGETAKKRNNWSYKKFRAACLKRDGYMCRICGSNKDLQVHHIEPFATFPALRYEPSNGITLCSKCHKELHRKEREHGR